MPIFCTDRHYYMLKLSIQANLTDLPHDTRPCLRNYSSLGYCPEECEQNSASLTLAYAYDDWLV